MPAATGPLDGLTVLEFSRVAPGAFCTMMLGDLGASVIKVESPPGRSGTGSAVSPTRAAAATAPVNSLNRNKRSLSVDLKSGPGRELVIRLVARADVLVDGFRPGVMDKLGLGPDAVASINPGLVYCALTSFGSAGPYAAAPGHDLTYVGMSGLLGVLAGDADVPMPPLNLVADIAGGALHAVVGVLAALVGRQVTGCGQFVDISYLDSTLALFAGTSVLREHLATGAPPDPATGFLRGRYPYYRTYRTRDGGMLCLGCLEPAGWARFCQLVGRPDLTAAGPAAADRFRPPSEEHVRAAAELAALFSTRDRDQWFDELIAHDIAVGKVYDLPEVWSDPQIRHRGTVLGWPPAGPHAPAQIAPAVRLSGTPAAVRTPPPLLGQDSAEILRSIGVTDEEIAELVRCGAIHGDK